ncbi:polyketide synthase-related [Holotrichia oblita]|nr:polyketide synthase-related [Holotrichia oblita]
MYMKRVVVTGMGAISPIGNDLATYWQGLTDGKCGIDFITKFDTTDFKVKIAAEVKDFNPSLYMDKGDIRRSDLFTQYAVAAATQAVNDSAIVGNVLSERFGVYFSSGIGGIKTLETESNKLSKNGAGAVSPYFITMMIENMAAGLIAIKHNAQGPSLSVVTACATGTNSIGEAYRAIKHGYADAIITGGSEAAITPISIAGFTSCMALCENNDPQKSSIPFDKNRCGFVMGEGAGALVLEEYEHAVRRGARIYAEVCGYSNACDAYHITAPRADAICTARAIKNALDEAGIIDIKSLYINAHGTSTQLNDKTETLAYKTALGARVADALISSTKSMIGHCLGAAGALEAVATIKAINDGVVPPTIGLNEADPECDLNYVPHKKIERKINAAISVNMGFGGHDACIAFKKI